MVPENKEVSVTFVSVNTCYYLTVRDHREGNVSGVLLVGEPRQLQAERGSIRPGKLSLGSRSGLEVVTMERPCLLFWMIPDIQMILASLGSLVKASFPPQAAWLTHPPT